MTGETSENPSLPGSRLREQRERRGLTLAQAGSELHINQRLLAALEEDDYAALGAPIFVKGHLRNYARLLGLDPSELVAAYEAAQQPADPTLVAHRPDGPRMDEHRTRSWVGWLGWGFLLILGVLLAAWWYYQQEGGADFVLSNKPEQVLLPDDTPSATSPASDAPEPQATETQTALNEGQPEDDGAAETPPAPENDGGTTTAQAPVTAGERAAIQGAAPVTQAPARQAPTSTRPSAPAGANGLVLEFTEESWVEIYDAEGRPILYDLLGPGTRREINAGGELRLFLGNASGVEVYVDGERFNVDRYLRSDNTARFTVNVPTAD